MACLVILTKLGDYDDAVNTIAVNLNHVAYVSGDSDCDFSIIYFAKNAGKECIHVAETPEQIIRKGMKYNGD